MTGTALTEQFAVRWGTATHPGRHRPENEDSLLAKPPVFLVADGMGGHLRGREASTEVVRAFEAAAGEPWLTPEALEQAAVQATERVLPLGDDGHDAPGSTVSGVGLTLHEECPSWLVFNIGDSRTYLLHRGVLEQITVDHSQVQELIDIGVPADEARHRVPRNVITRAIGGGIHAVPRMDQWLVPAHAGDRILICSDGLSEELTPSRIAEILQSFANADEAADRLVSAALDAGGRDNVTALVIDAVSVRGESTPVSNDADTAPLEIDTRRERTAPDLAAHGVGVGEEDPR